MSNSGQIFVFWVRIVIIPLILVIWVVTSHSKERLVISSSDDLQHGLVDLDSSVVGQTLGPGVVSVIKNSLQVSRGRMALVSEAEVKRMALVDEQRIGGYPIVGELSVLTKGRANRLINWLLSDDSYAPENKIRCDNTKLLGVRFQYEAQKVEFVLGLPCAQGIWWFMSEQGKRSWVITLSGKGTKELVNLLAMPSVSSP